MNKFKFCLGTLMLTLLNVTTYLSARTSETFEIDSMTQPLEAISDLAAENCGVISCTLV